MSFFVDGFAEGEKELKVDDDALSRLWEVGGCFRNWRQKKFEMARQVREGKSVTFDLLKVKVKVGSVSGGFDLWGPLALTFDLFYSESAG